MLSKIVIFACLVGSALSSIEGQAISTAGKTFDIQLGGTFVLTRPDYGTQNFKGAGGYAIIDFRRHLGVELDYRQAGGPLNTYERNYEAGVRYVLHYNRVAPYAKLMVGRGVFNFPPYPNDPSGLASANLAYNLFAFGGGADYALKPYLNLRADFEYQEWGSDPYLLTTGISPMVFSVGAAWHFR